MDNHNVVVAHLEPEILECEVKCALGSFTLSKANGGNEIPAEIFKILKEDAVKVLHSMLAHLESSAGATRLEKVSFHSNPRKVMPKNIQTTI